MADGGVGAGGRMAWIRPRAGERKPVDLKTDQPHTARMYDYFLGGKDNFPADREAGQRAMAGAPDIARAIRANRAFLVRAARYLAAEAGIRQFLDIGTGIPTSPNLHEVAQAITPDARVVYVDNDPLVLAHARALLTSTPAGRTAYLDADLRDIDAILAAPELRDTLDLSQPVALSVLAILHFLPDTETGEPFTLVRRLLDALPAGSCLVVSHGTPDFAPAISEQGAAAYRAGGIAVQLRRRDEFARFFDGLELVDPGIVPVHRWRPDTAPAGAAGATVVPGRTTTVAGTGVDEDGLTEAEIDDFLADDPSGIATAGLADSQVNMYGAVGRFR
ncbi:SAM-dependent methyltransferase [Frankia sp. Ag45/Mut15]|uniref:SAM-dependent methyltransferase n=1 Tax=Frankia umida TaxID=573489 RepID=A0ABT0K0M8_9ACTN|nr:SAM-dependent methyltransferase [Frankia umida]MCK9877364.1 SAM-dependent methyltransferase [Frankia umida]